MSQHPQAVRDFVLRQLAWKGARHGGLGAADETPLQRKADDHSTELTGGV
jgi:hypothetical protein